MGMFEKGSKHSEKGRVSTEFIEHSGSRSPTAVEDGSAHGLQGSTEKDVPLTQEDIDWTNEFAESERARKLVRRLDWKLIPILVVIYLVGHFTAGAALCSTALTHAFSRPSQASFLDRGNIGVSSLHHTALLKLMTDASLDIRMHESKVSRPILGFLRSSTAGP